MSRPVAQLDRRQHARIEMLRPTPAWPCDRCLDVTPLYPNGPGELLCAPCHPGIRERQP